MIIRYLVARQLAVPLLSLEKSGARASRLVAG